MKRQRGYRQRLRTVLLLHPFELPLAICLVGVAMVFTIWPEALLHSAISFETRGIIHHIGFHYPLLFGALAVVIGLVKAPPRGLAIEFGGILLLLVALMLNLTALIAAELDPRHADPSGLGIALRAGVMLGFMVRAYIILRRATVVMPVSRDA